VTRVFAVEDTAIELDWRHLARGEHTVEVGGHMVVVEGHAEAAAVWIDGLEPATEVEVVLDGQVAARTRTLTSPPGPLLARIATIGDLHVGDGWTFGVLPTLRHPGGAADPVVERCLRAALEEIGAWAPDLLVVKGDITHHGTDAEWARAAVILGAFHAETGIPLVATIGNHDVPAGPTLGTEHLGRHGIELVAGGVAVRDLPGIRVVIGDATVHRRHHGSFRRVGDDILDALAGAQGPALLAVHHQLHPVPVLSHWPPGIREGDRFARRIAVANPDTLVTSGHTHRHRRRNVGPVVITEIGSPKDHPGTWGGYAVHEGGIRQVVRRTAAPDVIAWTEATGRALLGAWGRWSPGRLGDRCFVHVWGGRPPR
jgi:predicted phosphodiesterase